MQRTQGVPVFSRKTSPEYSMNKNKKKEYYVNVDSYKFFI